MNFTYSHFSPVVSKNSKKTFQCMGSTIREPDNGRLLCPGLSAWNTNAKQNQFCELKCERGYQESLKKAMCYNIGWRPAIAIECSGNGITPGAIVGMLIGGIFLICVAAWFYTRYQQQEEARKNNGNGGGTVAQRTDSRANNQRRGFQNFFQGGNSVFGGQVNNGPGRATVFRNNSMSAPLSQMNKNQTMSYPQAGNLPQQQNNFYRNPQRTVSDDWANQNFQNQQQQPSQSNYYPLSEQPLFGSQNNFDIYPNNPNNQQVLPMSNYPQHNLQTSVQFHGQARGSKIQRSQSHRITQNDFNRSNMQSNQRSVQFHNPNNPLTYEPNFQLQNNNQNFQQNNVSFQNYGQHATTGFSNEYFQ